MNLFVKKDGMFCKTRYKCVIYLFFLYKFAVRVPIQGSKEPAASFFRFISFGGKKEDERPPLTRSRSSENISARYYRKTEVKKYSYIYL